MQVHNNERRIYYNTHTLNNAQKGAENYAIGTLAYSSLVKNIDEDFLEESIVKVGLGRTIVLQSNTEGMDNLFLTCNSSPKDTIENIDARQSCTQLMLINTQNNDIWINVSSSKDEDGNIKEMYHPKLGRVSFKAISNKFLLSNKE